MDSMPPLRYASFWKRFYAYGYDATIVAILAVIASMMVGDAGAQGIADLNQTLQALQQMQGEGGQGDLMAAILDWARAATFDALLISAPYNIGFVIGRWQATPGKRFCGIKVVNADGSKLTLLQSVARHAASGLSVMPCYLGFLPIFFTREKLALHDMICNTRVVYREVV